MCNRSRSVKDSTVCCHNTCRYIDSCRENLWERHTAQIQTRKDKLQDLDFTMQLMRTNIRQVKTKSMKIYVFIKFLYQIKSILFFMKALTYTHHKNPVFIAGFPGQALLEKLSCSNGRRRRHVAERFCSRILFTVLLLRFNDCFREQQHTSHIISQALCL